MRVFIAAGLIALTGCGSSSGPAILPSRVAVRPVADVRPARIPVVPDGTIVPIEPVVAPTSADGLILRRSIYEQSSVAEWTLPGGLRVVYLQEPASGYQSILRSTGAVGSGISLSSSDRLADALDQATGRLRTRPGGATPPAGDVMDLRSSTLILSGPLDWPWVEAAVARKLGSLATPLQDPEPDASGLEIQWQNVPALWIVRRVLRERGGESGLAWQGTRMVLRADSLTLDRWASPVPAGDVARLRDEAVAYARSRDGRIEALSDLYHVDGRIRPVAPPASALTLARRIAQTPVQRVDDLLARLASASRDE